ncbi:MAG: glycosyltransferase family 4 protein [Chloroflexi bacterium]|nr:glycosyltransferase family 4 protein [Chloroflexota bacterium]
MGVIKDSVGKRHCMIVHARYPLGEPRVEREAQALVNGGYEVDVLCLRNDDELPFQIEDGVNVHRLPVKRNKGRGLAAQMWEYLAFFVLVFLRLFSLYPRRKYRTLQVHNLPDFLVFSTLLPKLFGARVILDLHDLMPEFFAGTYARSMESLPVRLLILQERLACRFADHVITVTDLWRKTLIERGVPAEKVSVVMNVANGRVFNAQAAGAPRKSDDRFRLIYHGNLAQRYGIDLLLRAVVLVRETIPQIHLLVHGRGEYYQNLIVLANELRMDGSVTFNTSLLPIADLPALIRQADIGIVPYRRGVFTDGILPTKLMEYTAVCIPVIAARTPAIEAYFDEDMVQFFPPGDVQALAGAIIYLHQQPARRKQLASKASRFNKIYDWQDIAKNYLLLVERLPETNHR